MALTKIKTGSVSDSITLTTPTIDGVLTANAGVVVDNFTLDGTTLALSSGNMTLDVAGNIILDADGGFVAIKDGGTEIGNLGNSSSDFTITSSVQDKDILFKGNDNGTTITALTLDMSTGGTAYFADAVWLLDGKNILLGTDGDMRVRHDNSNGYIDCVTGSIILRTGGGATERFSIESGGGISTYPAAGGTFVVNEDGVDADFRVESDTNTHALFVEGSSSVVNFGRGSSNIESNGGYISAGLAIMSISSSAQTYFVRNTSGTSYSFYVTGAGQIHAVQTSISSLSDERLKENIVDIDTGLAEVMALKPRKFDWKEGEGSNEKNVAGFIAQEVETVLPELIGDFLHDDLDDAKSVKMGDMVPTLVKAIQEQQSLIETLTARIAALEE